MNFILNTFKIFINFSSSNIENAPSHELGPSFPINDLPDDLLFNIFNLLSIPQVSKLSLVCKRWHQIANTRILSTPHCLWKILVEKLQFDDNCETLNHFPNQTDQNYRGRRHYIELIRATDRTITDLQITLMESKRNKGEQKKNVKHPSQHDVKLIELKRLTHQELIYEALVRGNAGGAERNNNPKIRTREISMEISSSATLSDRELEIFQLFIKMTNVLLKKKYLKYKD